MLAGLLKTLVVLFVLLPPVARAGGDPLDDPKIQRLMRGLRDVTTISHPDLFGMATGLRRYVHHDYAGALKYFEVGAYYADKFSQLNIGLMHMNGDGAPKDPVAAYAWIELSAERGYPDFVATRDSLKATLTPEQLARAQTLRAELEKRYGDAVAKHRMELQLRVGLMDAFTGSRTGYDGGVVQIHSGRRSPLVQIGGHALPSAGCDGRAYLSKDNWKPELYFAARDREWKEMRGKVTVGPVADGGAVGKGAKKEDEAAAASRDDLQTH